MEKPNEVLMREALGKRNCRDRFTAGEEGHGACGNESFLEEDGSGDGIAEGGGGGGGGGLVGG
jgi:hypothetical protein